jgi:hypothetical protein
VVDAWWARLPRDTTQPPWRLIRPESVTVIDDATLRVTLTQPVDSPRTFAHPLLAVTKTVVGSAWPLGTGSYRVADANDSEVGRRTIVAVPSRSSRMPVVRFRASDGSDVRDHLDRDVDLLVTANPRALAYAASRPGLIVRPLPWDRTYVLMSRVRMESEIEMDSGLPPAVRSALARDAVRAPSRGSETPYWWQDVAECQLPLPRVFPPVRPLTANRIVYDETDPVARDIAQRMVALLDGALVDGQPFDARGLFGNASDRRRRFTAVGMDPERFAREIAAGHERAFVTAVARRSVDACGAVASLVKRMPWLAADVARGEAGQPSARADRLGLDRILVPLVDTRAHLVVRADRIGRLELEWDGTVRMSGDAR